MTYHMGDDFKDSIGTCGKSPLIYMINCCTCTSYHFKKEELHLIGLFGYWLIQYTVNHLLVLWKAWFMLPRTRENAISDPVCSTSCLYSVCMTWMMDGAIGVLGWLACHVESLLSLSKRIAEQTPEFWSKVKPLKAENYSPFQKQHLECFWALEEVKT